MNATLTYFFVILFWLLSLLEQSGWGVAMQISDKSHLLVAVMAFLIYINKQKFQKIPGICVCGLILTFIIIPYINKSSLQGASYLTAFLVVYIFSQAKVSKALIKNMAFAIAGLGIVIMLIYTQGTVLAGWNDNAISMIGLFSFIFFSVVLVLQKKRKSFLLWNIITVIYLSLLFATNCRSGMLFSIIAVIAIVYSKKVSKLFKNRFINILLLNLPLLIALLVISIGESSYFSELDKWSKETMESGKGIFNGRDHLWSHGLLLLEDSSYIGTGKFIINYHNSSIACLSVFGVLGYIFWIQYFESVFKQLRVYLSDNIVFGCMLGFTIIFLQQTVDLGFISTSPNYIPYMILGLGLGRIQYIKNRSLINNG